MSRKSGQQPTIMDVAEKAGVSTATVSRVINRTGPVAESTADAVWQAIHELQYSPNVAARGLASQRKQTVGLLLPNIGGDFFAAMLRGIERGLIESSCDLLVHSTTLDRSAERPFQRILGEHNTDGILVFSNSLDAPELRQISSTGFPVVLLYRSSPEDLQIPSVVIENKNGALQIVNHLIRVHNRSRILFLRGPDGHEDSTWREIGYRQALEQNNLAPDPELIGYGGFTGDRAYEAIQSMLRRGVEFDAVFAGDDEAASGVLRALHELGIPVPDQVSVVGFDDSSLARHLHPPLTTMDAQIEEAGCTAARKLINLIETGSTEPVTLLPTKLVIRQSCGCKEVPQN